MGLGKLVLKGGETIGGVKKKKKHKKKRKDKAIDNSNVDLVAHGEACAPGAPHQRDSSEQDKGTEPSKFEYEKEFKFETARMKEGKARSTAWGATYRAPPNVLHGYEREVKGETYEERLDLRCAKKADRMCK
jgi:hypothetical protein